MRDGENYFLKKELPSIEGLSEEAMLNRDLHNEEGLAM